MHKPKSVNLDKFFKLLPPSVLSIDKYGYVYYNESTTNQYNTGFRTHHAIIIVPCSVLVNRVNTLFRIFVGIHKKGGTALGTLYENIIALCNERGIKGGKMCTDIGMSKGILTDLKMGRQSGISTANAQKIASYFGVTVGYLLGEEQEKTATNNDSGMSEAKQKLFALAESCSEEEASRLLQMMELFLGK
jgi:transcriptional regulator with XRE-family HTH domain